MKECPAKLNIECEECPYGKESLCDYPYVGAVKILIGSSKEGIDAKDSDENTNPGTGEEKEEQD